MARASVGARLAAIAFAVALAEGAFAQTPPPAPPAPAMPRVISVSGEAHVSAKPDQARLSAGVVTQAETAAAALEANSAAMNQVFTAIKQQGIPDNKIQTSNFSVSPQYPPYRPDNPEPQRIVGYQVSNQVMVTVDDLTKLGAALDALVKSGANQLGGISFSIADPKPLAEQARKNAVADATAKAKTLAASAGVALGQVISIQEGASYTPPVPMVNFRVAAQAEAVPVASGEQEVSVNVSMSFAIQ